MAETVAQDEQTYHVVVNQEEQYSIWPTDQELPSGWRLEGTTGPESVCLAHIDEVWTDMRPLSLRTYMNEHANDEPVAAAEDEGPSLVDRLSAGDQPVRAVVTPEGSAAAFGSAIEAGYVFIRFTGTAGETELGVTVDAGATDTAGADFAAGSGRVTVSGTLNLDFEDVRCVAVIDLSTLTGEGHLERV
jgi:uncharacterized protein YbdZ (MbtH family)